MALKPQQDLSILPTDQHIQRFRESISSATVASYDENELLSRAIRVLETDDPTYHLQECEDLYNRLVSVGSSSEEYSRYQMEVVKEDARIVSSAFRILLLELYGIYKTYGIYDADNRASFHYHSKSGRDMVIAKHIDDYRENLPGLRRRAPPVDLFEEMANGSSS